MKIRHIPAQKFGQVDSNALRISPQVQLLFGYVDADTTAIRNSIRYLYFGRDDDFVVSDMDRAELELQFDSSTSIGSRFADGIRLREPATRHEFERTLREIDYATYRSFFDLNFGDGDVSGSQLCFQLQQRFNVPYGDVVNDVDEETNRLTAEKLKLKISQVNREIKSSKSEMERLAAELEALNEEGVASEFERTQKISLGSRIEKLRAKLELLRARACELEDEIEQASQNAVPAKELSGKGAFFNANHQLSDQLASIDAQVARWKNVKNDVENRLTDLQGDLCSSRVAEFDTAFDELRLSIGWVEEKLLEWLDKEPKATDAKSDLRIRDLQSLVSMQHHICESLANVQENWRGTIVNNEINDLNRCSSEMSRYLDRLGLERKRLECHGSVHSNYCQCKSHPTARVDLEYVENLQRQHAEILSEIELTRKLLVASEEEWNSIRDACEVEGRKNDLRSQLPHCQRRHSELQDEKDELLVQLRATMVDSELNSRLVQLVSGYVRFLTNERINRVFLQLDGRDLELVGVDGKTVSYRQADFETRNKTRMAISLGCAQLLAESGYSVPLVWEDPFVGMQSDEVDLVVRVLNKFSKSYGQVILLTNNRMIQSLFDQRDIPCLDIPDRYSGDHSSGVPFETSRPKSISVSTDWARINKNFDLAAMDQHGTELYWFENENGRIAVSRDDVIGEYGNNESERTSSKSLYRTDGNERSSRRDSTRSRKSTRGSRRSSQSLENESHSNGDSQASRSNDYTNRSSSSRSSSSRNSTSRRSSSGNRDSSKSPGNRTQSGGVGQAESRHFNQSTGGGLDESRTLKFYLELASQVEAAPTIGPKTAERLGAIGIYTVADLINHQADWIATKLDHRRIKTEEVLEWQQQALLVCQVPHLRGHDAQLLVACGIESASELAAMDPVSLFEIIDPFAQSKEGQKLLRGSKDPDLEEVTGWVQWARQLRVIERAA